MIEIEIINACLVVGSTKDPVKLLAGIDSYCVVKMFGKEIARTEVAPATYEPIWHEKFSKELQDLISKEVIHNRPFYLENIDVEVFDCSKSVGEKHVKLFETRVPISNIGLFKSYKLLRCSGTSSHESKEPQDESRIFVRINRVANEIYDKVEHFKFQQLSVVCPIHCPLYRHLYLDFSWSPNSFTYSSGLPGPVRGELLVDRYYFVEWKVASGVNIFGDKLAISCTGELLITDLRVIFVPYEIHAPALTWGAENVSLKDPMHFLEAEDELSPSETLAVQRYTFQLPLSALQECRTYQLNNTGNSNANTSNNAGSTGDSSPLSPSSGAAGIANLLIGSTNSSPASVLSLDAADGTCTEFIIRKHHGARSQRKNALGFDRIMSCRIKQTSSKLDSPLYRSGLDSRDIDPAVWCERVQDYLQWEIKLDLSWIRWAKCLKRTCRQFTSQGSKAWLKKALSPIDLDVDFQRLRVQDMDWRLSDLNGSYALCPTYPSMLVFPGSVQEEDILGAAADRSIGRLPALVWLHPDTKAPLCRAAQPLSGMSGNTIEQDKKMCLAIKQSCPTGLPLRIADARPKLNANANAMQGKGFENISFLGGPSVASIVFMDIDNIHVVRHSLAKLRESLHIGSNTASEGSAGISSSNTANAADGSTVHASKWTSHISSILKGAAGVADSLMLGYPVLVHCSDGWDRTAQLTSLAQLMIDPYYRTVDGFLALLQKEWCAFGHKFEDRLGRRGHSKEVSPVCLQFLDCVWQMARQFPTAFEFTTALPGLIAQAMYSGLFINFRRNSERDRTQMMRSVGPYEDMQTDDFDYATLAAYVNLLLRTSNVSASVLNSNYVPPKPSQKQVHYIRPAFGLHDLDLWKDGLCGLNSNVHASSTLSAPSVTSAEASVIQHDVYTRISGYVDLHMGHLPNHVRSRLEVIQSTEYPGHSGGGSGPVLSTAIATSNALGDSSETQLLVNRNTAGCSGGSSSSSNNNNSSIEYLSPAQNRLLKAIYPHSAVLNPASNVTHSLLSQWRHDEYDIEFHEVLDSYRAEEAVIRLQLWVRAILIARRALGILEGYIEEKGLQPPSGGRSGTDSQEEDKIVDVEGWVTKRKALLRKSLYSAKPRSYFRVFYILSASQARTARRARAQLQHSRAQFVRSIVDDALESAMIYCIRNDNFQLAYSNLRSTAIDMADVVPPSLSPLIRGSADYSKSPDGKKSLSSRIFGGFGGGSGGGSRGDGSPSGSTATASASAAALAIAAGEATQGGSGSAGRSSGSFSPVRSSSDGRRSHSPTPKPSLMGRLLGSSSGGNK